MTTIHTGPARSDDEQAMHLTAIVVDAQARLDRVTLADEANSSEQTRAKVTDARGRLSAAQFELDQFLGDD